MVVYPFQCRLPTYEPYGVDVGKNCSSDCSGSGASFRTSKAVLGVSSFRGKKPIQCLLPTESQRMNRNIAVKPAENSWRFRPLESLSVHNDDPVPGWMLHVHPSGQPYYECVSSKRRFRYITEACLTEQDTLEEINAFIDELERDAISCPEISSDVEVFLQIDGGSWAYYMVHIPLRRIFWVHDCQVVLKGFGIERPEHLRKKFEAEFWRHVQSFPCHRPIIPGVLDELLGILSHAHIDLFTSLNSHVPYDKPKIHSLMNDINNMQELIRENQTNSYVTSSSARVMEEIALDRYYNFYGFQGARLSADQSVRGQPINTHSWLISVLSPMLFCAPSGYFTVLNNVWIDGSIRSRFWEPIITRLEKDWGRFVLYSMLLLHANVMLQIVSFLISGYEGLWMSLARSTSQVSVITSIGSILTGFLLSRRSQNRQDDKTSDLVSYLRRKKEPRRGLETLAVQYSLPYALFAWCITTFLASIILLCIALEPSLIH